MKLLLLRWLAVGMAGFAGALARLWLGTAIGRLPVRFPLGTMVINISGCLFLGWFLTYAANRQFSDTTKLAIATGFVGAYTTFSTFAYESAVLADEKAWLEMMLNVVGSLVLGLLAVQLGMLIARRS